MPDVKLLKHDQPRLTFRVIRFNCKTGVAEETFDYPVDTGRRNSIYISGQDTVLVAVDDQLQILSHHPIDTHRQDKAQSYFIMQSVSGNTLLIEQHGLKGRTILEPDTLRIRQRCLDTVGVPVESITDSSEFFLRENSYIPDVTILKGPFCEKSSAVMQITKRVPQVEAVNDSKYALLERDRLEIDNTDAGEMFHYNPGKHEEYDQFETRFSQNGLRIALAVITYKGGSAMFDKSPTVVSKKIVVYDLDARRTVGSVPIHTTKAPEDLVDFCLTPDGARLAILNHGLLEIWPVG